MEQKLPLSIPGRDPSARSWRLDEATREAGRRGIEASRRALEEATARRGVRLATERHAA